MGTPVTALPTFDAIRAAGHDLPLVVTQPDRPAGRSKAPQPPPVKAAAAAKGLPVLQPSKIRTDEFARALDEAKPDAIVVVAYGRILPRAVLDAAPHGAINLHFSLLPAYRGAAPVQWALARGERATGVTTFRIDEGLDTGPILVRRAVAIEEREKAPALLARLAGFGAEAVVETLAGLSSGTMSARPQEPDGVSLAPLLTREDGAWQPQWSAQDLEGRTRGFDPWPGVWADRSGDRLRIVSARALPGRRTAAASGNVMGMEDDALMVACASGTVAAIDEIQREGGRVLSAKDAANGRLLAAGDRLEHPRRAS